MCYKTNAKGLPIDGQPSKIGLKVITACLRPGGYFFLFTVTTSAMIDTISVPKRNKSLYVTIGTALLSGGKAPSRWRANRLPVMVALKDALLHHVNFSIEQKYCQINTNCHSSQRFEEIFSNLFSFYRGRKMQKKATYSIQRENLSHLNLDKNALCIIVVHCVTIR